MPTMRKLMPAEIETLEGRAKGPRKLVEEQYDRIVFAFDAGEYGEAELESGEKRFTVRNRLDAAAKRRGLTLDFLRTTGNVLRFRVHEPNSTAATPVVAVPSLPTPAPTSEVASPAKKRRGRPKRGS
jgi:hypothetical protein